MRDFIFGNFDSISRFSKCIKIRSNSSKNITIEPKQENISNENHLGIFKEIPYKDENDNFQENNQSILEEQIKDLNLSSIIDGNLSKIDGKPCSRTKFKQGRKSYKRYEFK